MMRLLFSLLLICSLAACGQSEAAQGGLSSIPPMAASVPLSGLPLVSGITSTSINFNVITLPSGTVHTGDVFFVSCYGYLLYPSTPPSYVLSALTNGGTAGVGMGGNINIGMSPVSYGNMAGMITTILHITSDGTFIPTCTGNSDKADATSNYYWYQMQIMPLGRTP